MTLYRCPRHDLDCEATFPTTGELDFHLHMAHGYRRVWRLVASLPRSQKIPVGPEPRRRVPDGLAAGPGTPTIEQAVEKEEREKREKEQHGRLATAHRRHGEKARHT